MEGLEMKEVFKKNEQSLRDIWDNWSFPKHVQ